MKKQIIFTLILTLTLLTMPGQGKALPHTTSLLLPDINAPETTYWVSPNGEATWENCNGADELNGTSACALSTANENASAGDTIYLRGGDYPGQEIHPKNSGTSDENRIIYTNYNQEEVTIRDSAYGIYLYGNSYVTVNGINFYSMRRFMRIYASHHNTISYCNFDTRSPQSGDWVGALIADDPEAEPPGAEDSTYNWVHHCTFYRWVYGAYDEHRGALLDIGSSSSSAGEDQSYYNLVEDNTFAYGGHHTLAVYSKYNVIRNNYFHNETNAENWNYEGYRATLTEGPYAGYSLYEGNRFGFAGASGIALRSQHNILRFNTFYQNGSGAIQCVANVAGIDHADYNHIFQNSFFHNGHQATYAGFQGGMYFSSWSGQDPIGNVVKNNIFYDNKNGSVSYDGQVEPQEIENNWDQNDLDPGFVNPSGNDPDNPDLPDLHLKSDSTAIDAGTWLTTITSDSGSGTLFDVADAGYFVDGWGIIEGDLIQLANGQRARIEQIENNTISVNTELSWTQNMGISLAYEGTASDLGAYEYAPLLKLYGIPSNQTIYLNWETTSSFTGTWHIEYYTTTTSIYTKDILTSTDRSTTLTDNIYNYQLYTITIDAVLGETAWLSDTIQIMPTDKFIHLPLVLK